MTTNEHQIRSELQALIDKHWASQDTMYAEISRMGFQKYFDSLPNKEQAFFTSTYVRSHEKCACCSDEGNTRVIGKNHENEVLIRTPGSGILQSVHERDKDPFGDAFIERTAREALQAGVRHFTAHSGCGAAKKSLIEWLAAQGKIANPKKVIMEEEGQYLQPAQIDAFADEWAKAVTKKMQEIDPDHAKDIHEDMLKNLDRPAIHIARCLYLTDIDELDSSFKGLPQGFVERTGGKENLKDVLDHIDTLTGIAFGPDGFGGKFSPKPEEQFVICCIARTPERLQKLKEDMQKKVDSLKEEEDRKCIRIDGFVRA